MYTDYRGIEHEGYDNKGVYVSKLRVEVNNIIIR